MDFYLFTIAGLVCGSNAIPGQKRPERLKKAKHSL
jgi:hypothetical protein